MIADVVIEISVEKDDGRSPIFYPVDTTNYILPFTLKLNHNKHSTLKIYVNYISNVGQVNIPYGQESLTSLLTSPLSSSILMIVMVKV
jgi:hypothetical protein